MNKFKLIESKELFEINKGRQNFIETKARKWLLRNRYKINHKLKKSAKHDEDIRAIFCFNAMNCDWDILKEISKLIVKNNANYSARCYRADLMIVELEISVKLGGTFNGTT